MRLVFSAVYIVVALGLLHLPAAVPARDPRERRPMGALRVTSQRGGGAAPRGPAPAGRRRGPFLALALVAIVGLLVVAVGLRPGGDAAASPGPAAVSPTGSGPLARAPGTGSASAGSPSAGSAPTGAGAPAGSSSLPSSPSPGIPGPTASGGASREQRRHPNAARRRQRLRQLRGDVHDPQRRSRHASRPGRSSSRAGRRRPSPRPSARSGSAAAACVPADQITAPAGPRRARRLGPRPAGARDPAREGRGPRGRGPLRREARQERDLPARDARSPAAWPAAWSRLEPEDVRVVVTTGVNCPDRGRQPPDGRPGQRLELAPQRGDRPVHGDALGSPVRLDRRRRRADGPRRGGHAT